MTYQGTRARAADDESKRVFEMSKIRLATDGRISHVLWAEVDAPSDHDVSAHAVVPVADAVDAIHGGAQVAAVFLQTRNPLPERVFVVVEHKNGRETIDFDGEPSAGRELSDIDTFDEKSGRPDAAPVASARVGHRKMSTFAVSKVELDADGRVVAVLWGRVNTSTNAWATEEAVAPVADAVKALHEGHQVFALFPSTHGHLPERRFVTADYDDGRQTIVLEGRTAHEREIHDMDRLDAAVR
jgi:hypothetical protein